MKDKIQILLDSIIDERKKLIDEVKPFRDRRYGIQQVLAPLEAELRELNKKILEIEGSKLIAFDKQISTLSTLLGAKVLNAESLYNGANN